MSFFDIYKILGAKRKAAEVWDQGAHNHCTHTKMLPEQWFLSHTSKIMKCLFSPRLLFPSSESFPINPHFEVQLSSREEHTKLVGFPQVFKKTSCWLAGGNPSTGPSPTMPPKIFAFVLLTTPSLCTLFAAVVLTHHLTQCAACEHLNSPMFQILCVSDRFYICSNGDRQFSTYNASKQSNAASAYSHVHSKKKSQFRPTALTVLYIHTK